MINRFALNAFCSSEDLHRLRLYLRFVPFVYNQTWEYCTFHQNGVSIIRLSRREDWICLATQRKRTQEESGDWIEMIRMLFLSVGGLHIEGDETHAQRMLAIDTIRPRWEEMLEERRSSAVGTTRRRRVQLNNGERSSRSARRSSSSYNLERFSSQESTHTIYDTFANVDLEDILVMEAIRLSLVTASATPNTGNDPPTNATTNNTTTTTNI